MVLTEIGDEIDDLLDDAGDDIDLRLARLEALLESMPVLMSSVVLRQNPHNVHEWHKRAKVSDFLPASPFVRSFAFFNNVSVLNSDVSLCTSPCLVCEPSTVCVFVCVCALFLLSLRRSLCYDCMEFVRAFMPASLHRIALPRQLFAGQPKKISQVYAEAVATVDPYKCVGKLHSLWVEFAKVYEASHNLEEARKLFRRVRGSAHGPALPSPSCLSLLAVMDECHCKSGAVSDCCKKTAGNAGQL
jgi:hypothetical protein